MKLRKSLVLCLFYVLGFCCIIHAQNLHLTIEGESQLETQVIDSLNYKRIFEDTRTLFIEIDSSIYKLQKKGYISCEVISTEKINDSSYASKLSLKEKIDTIYIYYPKSEISAELIQSVSDEVTDAYFVVSTQELEQVLNYLSRKISENGQPFASLQLRELKKRDANSIQSRLDIKYGVKRQIDNIVVKGYEKFPKSYLKYFLGLKRGKAFNLEDINSRASTINALGFANQTRAPEVLFTNDSTEVYLYIEKVKSNSFDGFLGFGTNETTNKIELDGYINLRLINNLNYGETFLLSYKSDEIDQQTFNATLNLPYLFKMPLGTELNLNIFKKDSTFTTVQQSVDLFYQLNEHQRIFAGINSQQSNNLLDDALQNDVEDFDSFFITSRYQYVRRQQNDLLFPVNFDVELEIGFGHRKYESVTQQQQLYNANVSKIFNLNSTNSIYIRGTSSALFSDNYFTNELLRFGGINSIRGFEENSLFASLYGVVNTEYRYRLGSNMFIHSVFDLAYLDNDLTDDEQKLFGVGFGFGLITNAGLLKFVFANGKFEDEKFKFSNSKVHLSLNATF